MRIGLVLNILEEEYQISLYRGIVQRAAELGIQIICFQEQNTKFLTDAFIGSFPQKDYFNLDGIILLTSVLVDNYILGTKEDIKKMWGDLPVVSVGQKIEGVPSLLVQTDDSMRDLVEHLVLTHKYRSFVYIGGSLTHQDSINREQLFTSLMEQYKADYNDLNYTIMRGNFNEQSAVTAMTEYTEKYPDKKPDVVVCANDNMAIGVYKFFKLKGRTTGIAVTGFDDIPQGKYSIPALTTVHQPLDKIGEQAVNIIYDFVKGKTVPLENSIGSSVIYRESCGCQKTAQDITAMREYFEKVQSSYMVSEQMLRIVSHVGRELNNDNGEKGLVSIIDYNTAMLGISDFCMLRFSSKLKAGEALDNRHLMVRPVFVRNKGKVLSSFPVDKNGEMTLGHFYEFLCSQNNCRNLPLIFKFLNAGNDYIGCLLYDAPENCLPYIILLSVDIAVAMSRMDVEEERRRYADYLESEVTKRTHELIEANNRRMEVEAEVLKISEIERQRFSNDLHDDICQRLAGISMLCKSYSTRETPVEKTGMEELAALVGDTLQRTRQYAHNSYPVDLETLGLDASLSNLCNSFEQQSDIKCTYKWTIPDTICFDRLQKLNIFRIIQEALHNVMKHSGAKNVNVSCTAKKNTVTVRVCDDGVGISQEQIKNFGIGLNSMQYRANQIGAEFKLEGQGGTIIQIKMKVESDGKSK